MKFRKASALIAFLAAAYASPVLAQNGNFEGFRAGLLGGVDVIRPGSSEVSGIRGDKQSVTGFLYGIDAGYDLALGGVVVGVEGEWSDSTGKVESSRRDPNDFGYGEVSNGRDLYLGARLGFLATPATLVYGKVGYTNARLDVLASDGNREFDDRFKLDGWRLGAGVEQSMGAQAYAKLEYRYSNYTDARLRFEEGGSTGGFEVDTDRHQVVAGIGFRF